MLTGSKLRMTKQRQLILEELSKVTSHPTADDMYQVLRKKMPRISLGTVYRNLEILYENGIIQKLDVGGTQKRFDANIIPHYHIRCTICGRVADIHIEPHMELETEAKKVTDFDIIQHRVEFLGICPQCKKRQS